MIFNATIAGGAAPTLITKSITANGTYNAEDDSADGYSSVTVNVSGSVPTASFDFVNTSFTQGWYTDGTMTVQALTQEVDYDLGITHVRGNAAVGTLLLYQGTPNGTPSHLTYLFSYRGVYLYSVTG